MPSKPRKPSSQSTKGPIPKQPHYVWPHISGTNWHAPVKKFQLYEKRLNTLLGHHEWHEEFQAMFEMAWKNHQLTPNKLVEIAMRGPSYQTHLKWLEDFDAKWQEEAKKYSKSEWAKKYNQIRSQIDPHWVEKYWFLKHLVLVRDSIKERQKAGMKYDHIDLMHELGMWVPAIRVKFNWIPYEASERKDLLKSKGSPAFAECWDTVAGDETKPTLPMLNPAFLTFQIPLTPASVWGLDEMVEAIRGVIRDAMKNCPTPKEAPNIVSIIPSQREFLLNVTDHVLKVDIRRYQMYMKHKLNFRQIAYWESKNKPTKPMKLSEIPSRIKGTVKNESAVSESVKRIYEALYLRKFTGSRRRKLDTQGPPSETYHCPDHPGDSCPETCKHLKKWLLKMNAILPGNWSGSGMETLMGEEFLEGTENDKEAPNGDNDRLFMEDNDNSDSDNELNF